MISKTGKLMKPNHKSSILLPIKQKYVEALFNRTKNFELRRRVPKSKTRIIYVYETSPTSRVVGRLFVKQMLNLKIADLWQATKGQNGLTKEEFETYFKNQECGFAFEISQRKRFKHNVKIEKYNLEYPPQGFVYIYKS